MEQTRANLKATASGVCYVTATVFLNTVIARVAVLMGCITGTATCDIKQGNISILGRKMSAEKISVEKNVHG